MRNFAIQQHEIAIRKLLRAAMLAHLDDSDCRHIAGRSTSKNQSIPLDMQIGQTIGHQKDRWSISRLDIFLFVTVSALLTVLFKLGKDASSSGRLMAVVPKFDLSKEGFRVASFMSTTVASIIPILFGNDGVSSRRQDKKVGYHGQSKRMQCR